MSQDKKICKGRCEECGWVIKGYERSSVIGGKKYHQYCWITKHTVAEA